MEEEKSATRKDSMFTHLAHRQGMGLLQKQEKEINKEYSYWESSLRRAIAAICSLAERVMVFTWKIKKLDPNNFGINSSYWS